MDNLETGKWLDQAEDDFAYGIWLGAVGARRTTDRKLTLRQKLEWNAQALPFRLQGVFDSIQLTVT